MLSIWVKRFNVIVAIALVLYVMYSFGYVAGRKKASEKSGDIQQVTYPDTDFPGETVVERRMRNRVRLKKTTELDHPPSASETQSIICTNYNEDRRLKYVVVPTKIYDVSFIAYTQEFAKRFGYPDSNVYPLDKGVQVMEFRLRTEGIWQEFYLNILMDKGLGLDVPPVPYANRAGFPVQFRFPKQAEGFKMGPEDLTYLTKTTHEPFGEAWENYFNRNFRMATLNYIHRAQGRSDSLQLKGFSNTYYKDFDYFSVGVNGTQEILEEGASLWVKKKGGSNYNVRVLADPNDFVKFKIPPELVEKTIPVMEEMGFFSFHINSIVGGSNKNATQ